MIGYVMAGLALLASGATVAPTIPEGRFETDPRTSFPVGIVGACVTIALVAASAVRSAPAEVDRRREAWQTLYAAAAVLVVGLALALGQADDLSAAAGPERWRWWLLGTVGALAATLAAAERSRRPARSTR